MEQNFSFSYDSDLNICLPNPVGVTDVHTYTLNQTVGDDASFTEWSSPQKDFNLDLSFDFSFRYHISRLSLIHSRLNGAISEPHRHENLSTRKKFEYLEKITEEIETILSNDIDYNVEENDLLTQLLSKSVKPLVLNNKEK